MATVEEFWAEFCEKRADIDPSTPYQVWYFGNSAEMAAELAGLVIAGKKRATASLVRTNEIKPDEAPQPDGVSVVTDLFGSPICIVQTTEMTVKRFADVDAEFAAAEGEGDLSLDHWRRVHADYFRREAEIYGFAFDDDSLVCCERFSLLYHR